MCDLTVTKDQAPDSCLVIMSKAHYNLPALSGVNQRDQYPAKLSTDLKVCTPSVL